MQEDKKLDSLKSIYNKYLLKNAPRRGCKLSLPLYLSKPAWVLELERPVFEFRLYHILVTRSWQKSLTTMSFTYKKVQLAPNTSQLAFLSRLEIMSLKNLAQCLAHYRSTVSDNYYVTFLPPNNEVNL